MKVARITLWGELVGALAHDTDSQLSTFEYAPEWVSKGIEFSPIHMPLSQRKFQFPHLSSSTFRGLPGVFADALMDGFGQIMTERWLKSQGRNMRNCSPLDLLQMVGQLGKGAIEFSPTQHPYTNVSAFDGIKHLAEAAHVITGDSLNLSNTDNNALDSLFQSSYTLSGFQPKAFVSLNESTGEMLPGLAIPNENFEEYLVKFGETDDPLQTNQVEYAYGLMAQACGIEICPTEVLAIDNAHHLLVKRFDREAGTKLHFLTYCGLAHADYLRPEPHSYEQLFSTMRQLRLDRSQAEQMVRRMVFNVIACNHNDHTKSVGFLMNQAGKWSLAPAYGLTYSNSMGQLESQQMSINDKTDRIQRNDLLSVIPTLYDETNQIIDEVAERVAAWPLFARQAGIDRELMSQIQRQHQLKL